MGKPSVPNATDTINSQNASNIFTGQAGSAFNNNVNYQTPFGSQTTAQTGTTQITGPDGKKYDIPQYTQTTTLPQNQQNLSNKNISNQMGVAKLAGQQIKPLGQRLKQDLFDPKYTQYTSGPQLQTKIGGADDYTADRQKVEDALFARYQPQLQADRDAQAQQLANQGVKLGSSAYNTAMLNQAQRENDARLGIILNAGEEQTRRQQLDLNAGTFSNAGNQQMYQNLNTATSGNNGIQDSMFANDLAQRNQLLNEQSVLMGLSGAGGSVQMPQFNRANSQGVAGTDVAGITQNAYNNQLNQSNNLWGGLGQAGAALAPWLMSDERVKTDKVRLGELANGIPVYSFRYIGEDQTHIGVMAQEAIKVNPDAVRQRPDGFFEVNYEILTRAA